MEPIVARKEEVIILAAARGAGSPSQSDTFYKIQNCSSFQMPNAINSLIRTCARSNENLGSSVPSYNFGSTNVFKPLNGLTHENALKSSQSDSSTPKNCPSASEFR